MALQPYKSITFKLCLAFTLVIVLVVAGVLTSNRISLTRSFHEHITERTQRELERLAYSSLEIYERSGSWEVLQRTPKLWRKLLVHSLIPPNDRPRATASERPAEERDVATEREQHERFHGADFKPEHGGHGTERDEHRPPPKPLDSVEFYGSLALWDKDKNFIVGSHTPLKNEKYYPIQQGENIVGYISYSHPEIPAFQFDRSFLHHQLTNSLFIALVAIALALLLAFPLARHIVKPLLRLTDATRALRAGDYKQRVPVETNDEIGQLSGHFNALAKTLDANETARRQWVADISHELRTPLSVLKAHIEAIQDGVRPATPDNIGKLQNKVDELSRLIDDLYQLSLSDLGALNYRRDAIVIHDFFSTLMDSLTPSFQQAGISLDTDIQIAADREIYADETRLKQLFQNLLHNSLNYTDSPGKVKFSVNLRNHALNVTIDDTKPGVAVSDIPKLFERLYRVEASRNRQSGGAGLGLAICKNIVEAHNGEITAMASELGGLKISLRIPLQD